MTRDDDDLAKAVTYRWTCPVCQLSRMGIAGSDENWRVKAMGSLKTHLQEQSDAEHGPIRSLPAGMTDDALMQSIEIQDDRTTD